jgi:hypothetical protein
MRNGHPKKFQEIVEHVPASAGRGCSPYGSWKVDLSGAAPSEAPREWIDLVIVPALVQDYIRESQQKPCPSLSVVKVSGASSGQSDEVAK